MANIIFPSNTREIINAIRGAIGRIVYFTYVASSASCTTCVLDPVTGTSTDSFCPECSGLYWIPIWSSMPISGHVTWGKHDVLKWESVGQYFDGDCRVQIEYTPENVVIVDNTQKTGYVKVDGKELEIKSRIFRGVKELNRILVNLIEK